MYSERGMMHSKKKPPNPLTKSMHLLGSGSDKESAGSTIRLGGIKLDFRKSSSGGGLMKMLTGGNSSSSNNKISDDVRKSREAGLSAKGSNTQIKARYSTIEMAKHNPNQVTPNDRY